MALIRVDVFSKSLMRTVTFNAIIPVGKLSFPGMPVREPKPFKTLYLLHGIFGNYTDWVSGTRIQRWAEDNNLAVIMPSGENKFYVDNVASNDLGSSFIKELVDVTRELFPLSNLKEDTFIGGLSMGGYGALVNGLKYHDTFGYIVGLSCGLILEGAYNSTDDAPIFMMRRSYYESIFGPIEKIKGSDKDYMALAAKLPKEQRPQIYLACGTSDNLYSANKQYYEYLKELKYDVTFVSGEGAHEWDFWDKYIHEALKWLPLETKTASVNSGNVLPSED